MKFWLDPGDIGGHLVGIMVGTKRHNVSTGEQGCWIPCMGNVEKDKGSRTSPT